ncbi:COMM domain-containing protein 10 [Operophtera brumata]|uniref:COMM domain-containing protein 10 n=1 Tax=Operophtera brumata TaxID=104452 RepID=A0A0L7L7B4_OPEBR|nr:COMM domain-containing protein 10 [Operophtera brumata]
MRVLLPTITTYGLWLGISVNKGVSILNQLDHARFEQFLRRIVSKLKIQDTEIFSDDERDRLLKIFQLDQESLVIAIKTIILIFKRLLKYIFMPNDLKKDLKSIGLSNEKADFIVKVWSTETRTTLNELGSEPLKHDDCLDFSWKWVTCLACLFWSKYLEFIQPTRQGSRQEFMFWENTDETTGDC